jgi:hypothetical protein
MKYIIVVDTDFTFHAIPERDLNMGEILAVGPMDCHMAFECLKTLHIVLQWRGLEYVLQRLPLALARAT